MSAIALQELQNAHIGPDRTVEQIKDDLEASSEKLIGVLKRQVADLERQVSKQDEMLDTAMVLLRAADAGWGGALEHAKHHIESKRQPEAP